MSDVSLDDEKVYCARCGEPITESYGYLGRCECGGGEWEYRPPNPFPPSEEVSQTHE